jgi:hypothetical protein
LIGGMYFISNKWNVNEEHLNLQMKNASPGTKEMRGSSNV